MQVEEISNKKVEKKSDLVEARNVQAPRVLGAGEWLRAVTGFQAPFGKDGMPTVWG